MTHPAEGTQTDDAEAVTVLAALRHCANACDSNARIVGNIRAGDISRVCRLAINALRSQGGKASMTSANLAALIHEARFPEGKDAPNYIPFLHEDRSGREYCLRIARKIIETVELAAAAPSPSGGAPDSVSAEEIGRYAAMCPPPARIVNETRMELLTIREKMAKIGAASWMQRATPSPAVSVIKPTDANISVLAEALYHCGCPAGGMTVGECAEQGVCGCSIRAERIKGCMGPDHQYFSREESQP